MKKTGFSLLVVMVTFSFWGCKDHFTQTVNQIANVPIYQPYEDMRGSLEMGSVSTIQTPGKIYFKDDHIFVSEMGKGIHVFDNSNPAAPVQISFIEIPGNVDIVIKDDILFADNFTDLVVIDVSDLTNCKLITRFEDAFPYALPPYDESYPIAEIDRSLGVIIGWKLEETESVCRDAECGGQYPVWPSFMFSSMQTQSLSSGGGSGRASSGVGGSMARFALSDNHLYVVSTNDLTIINVETPRAPFLVDKIDIGMGIETIFPYENNLFIGSETGMFIFDITSPANPIQLSRFEHNRSCDPVVVEGSYAYVTMRSGSGCGGSTNEMNVVDISNPSAPYLRTNVIMSNPHGLGVDGGRIFVCDGNEGLKIYSTSSNGSNVTLIGTKPEIMALDVIPYGGILMTIAADGLYQYDYSDINQMPLLSVIPIN